jgi:negative regulator of genetic competence, sporulation and motility
MNSPAGAAGAVQVTPTKLKVEVFVEESKMSEEPLPRDFAAVMEISR